MQPTAVKDNWDFWVFNIGLDGELGGQASETSREMDLDFSANRVTPKLKIQLGSSLKYDEEKYDYVCIDTETTGFHADKDEIIEVCAIKFKTNGVIGDKKRLFF